MYFVEIHPGTGRVIVGPSSILYGETYQTGDISAFGPTLLDFVTGEAVDQACGSNSNLVQCDLQLDFVAPLTNDGGRSASPLVPLSLGKGYFTEASPNIIAM